MQDLGLGAPPLKSAPAPPPDSEAVRWLALLIREGLLVIVAGIERRYGRAPGVGRR